MRRKFGRALDFAMAQLVLSLIIDIIFNPNVPPPGLLECVIVDFSEACTRRPPFFPEDENCEGCVPVFTETSEWYSPNDGKMETHSRTMFQLRLCYAWKIWKAQGQTYRSKVIVNLSDREREYGLAYTIFSRVAKPTDLGITKG